MLKRSLMRSGQMIASRGGQKSTKIASHSRNCPQCFIGITHNVVRQPVPMEKHSRDTIARMQKPDRSDLRAYVTQPGSVPPW